MRVWNYEKKCHGYGYFCALFDWKQIIKIVILFCFISQHLSGNSDKSSVVVGVFSSPFSAKFVRILPKIYHTTQCMRVDLFGCRYCKCSILCYIQVRLVIIFKGYYFTRQTYNNSLIIICVHVILVFFCSLFWEETYILGLTLHKTSISIVFHFR